MEPSPSEIERRYASVRTAAADQGLDAVLVCGSEYTGFEGAVRYLSGFRIVHRYAYALLPIDGEPTIVIPREARYVGRHADTWIETLEFPPSPGEWLSNHAVERGWRRMGVYGLDEVMPVRDYRPLSDRVQLVRFDESFDLARAAKSDEELDSVALSMRINENGFRAVLDAYSPGRTEAELIGHAEKVFAEQGCGRLTMDMVIAGPHGQANPEFRLPNFERPIEADDLLLYSLEVAGPGGHWVELSRPITAVPPSAETQRMHDAYGQSFETMRSAMRAGATAHDLHRAVWKTFDACGYQLGHVTGHSIGMTMIEHPRIGEGVDVVLAENTVLSMHPHVIADDGSCYFMQETWLVTPEGGRQLSDQPVEIFGLSPVSAAEGTEAT